MFALIGGIIGMLIALLIGGLGLALTVFWIWMLVDAITNKGIGDGEKIAWVLVIIFLHALGGLIYFFVGKPKRADAAV
jgi:phospholipase D-like protein